MWHYEEKVTNVTFFGIKWVIGQVLVQDIV